jgi:hypothetical protein
MKNTLIIIAMLIVSQNIYAYNTKGMKVYKKMCMECHGSPFRGAKMHTVMEWEEFFFKSKTPFKTIHEKLPKASKSLEDEYFTTKRIKHLKKFLIQNAKDAGTVPGCDGNYCGY